MNRVALDLGVIQIYWYSICILVGMTLGMFLVYKETLKKHISENLITNLIFYTIIVSIIGARVYYVIFDWGYYSKNPIEMLEIWNGGLAIHGAIIFGGLFLIYYTKEHKMDTLKILDICSVGLIIGQAIGRWGNFFNQEVYGGVVSREFLKGFFLPDFIVEGMKVGGEYHQPLFLYESLWCILGFVILLFIRKRKYIKTGQIFGIYCMWYSVGRFFLEGMRDEKYNLMLGSMKAAQIVSIGMFVVGLFFFIRRFKTSRFEFLYNDEGIEVALTNDDSKQQSFFDKKQTKTVDKKEDSRKMNFSVSPKQKDEQILNLNNVQQKKKESFFDQPPVQQNTNTNPQQVPFANQNSNQDNSFPQLQSNGPVLNNQIFTGQNNNQNNNQNNTFIR